MPLLHTLTSVLQTRHDRLLCESGCPHQASTNKALQAHPTSPVGQGLMVCNIYDESRGIFALIEDVQTLECEDTFASKGAMIVKDFLSWMDQSQKAVHLETASMHAGSCKVRGEQTFHLLHLPARFSEFCLLSTKTGDCPPRLGHSPNRNGSPSLPQILLILHQSATCHTQCDFMAGNNS